MTKLNVCLVIACVLGAHRASAQPAAEKKKKAPAVAGTGAIGVHHADTLRERGVPGRGRSLRDAQADDRGRARGRPAEDREVGEVTAAGARREASRRHRRRRRGPSWHPRAAKT
jgi:hypothetical protein